MEMFNKRLTVGCKAIIISTRREKNFWMIGKEVVVECIINAGDPYPVEYIIEKYKDQGLVNPTTNPVAVVSGVTQLDGCVIENHCLIDSNRLMPIDDDEMKNIFEEEGNPYMETVK